MKKKRKLFKNLIKQVSYDGLYNYYIIENHKRSDVASYLDVSDSTVKKLLKHFGIKKDTDLMMINHKKTMQERYGVDVYSQHPDWFEKTINTNIKKFGSKGYMQTSEYNYKTKNTIKNKYGSISEYYKDKNVKIKQTLLKRYNDENYNNKEKRRLTNLDRYGKEGYVQTDSFMEKVRKTSLENGGTSHYLKSEKGLKEYEDQIYNKYGVRCIFELIHSSKVQYVYDNEIFDSKPELAVWIYCKDHDIDIIHNPVVFKYMFNDKEHTYHPDFKICDNLIEIKGDHFIKEDGTGQNPFDHSQDEMYELKRQCAIENDVEIGDSKIYGKMIDYVNYTYGDDYISQFRIGEEDRLRKKVKEINEKGN